MSTLNIKTFQDYLSWRELGFFLPFDYASQNYPLLNGEHVTIEELRRDFEEFMAEPITTLWV